MPVIQDNSFSKDTYGYRSERLIAIQGNFVSIQSELNAPASIATWAEDCFDVYSNLLAISQVEMNESEGATAIVTEREEMMDEIYQNVKTMGTTIYKDLADYLEDYGFEIAYPVRRNDKFRAVDSVIEAYNRHKTAGITPLVPELMITRLSAARDSLKTAMEVQDKERSDARHSIANLSKRFESDMAMLNQLKSWWFAMLGKKDPRITLVGMVNPRPGGHAGKVPDKPANLWFHYASRTIWWTTVPDATSYQLERFDGTEYVEIYAGENDHFPFVPPDGMSKYRVRARNENGFGDFSMEIEQWYFAVLPKVTNIQIVRDETIPTSCVVSWDPIPTVVEYSVYQSIDEIGHHAAHWLYLGIVEVPNRVCVLTLGKRNYFKIEANNLYQTSVSAPVYIDV